MRPVNRSARSGWWCSVAWSRWRLRMVTNWGPVSKKPQRSQIDLERAVERGGPVAVAVAEEAAVVGGEASSWSGPSAVGGERVRSL